MWLSGHASRLAMMCSWQLMCGGGRAKPERLNSNEKILVWGFATDRWITITIDHGLSVITISVWHEETGDDHMTWQLLHVSRCTPFELQESRIGVDLRQSLAIAADGSILCDSKYVFLILPPLTYLGYFGIMRHLRFTHMDIRGIYYVFLFVSTYFYLSLPFCF